jgi:hypothetical protein
MEPLEVRALLAVMPFMDERYGMLEQTLIDSPPTPPSMYERASGPLPATQSAVLLEDVPTSTWTYGCSATSAGMIFGYYDRHGYPNMYTGPTNGGVAPLTDLGQGDDPAHPIAGACSIIATMEGFDGLATNGHVDDYWIAYNSEGPDPWEGKWSEHVWSSCTADYMGTNQWKWDFDGDGTTSSNIDGGTTYFSYSGATKLYDYVPPVSAGLPQTEMTHGMRLFAESRGYELAYNSAVGAYEVYTQKVDAVAAGGFSFTDFQTEINAGRPMLVQVTGHTMVGMGYDAATNRIYLHDTWDNSVHSMTWGGSYAGMAMQAITVLHLAPPPPTNDFGDAPAPYPTTAAQNGAQHTVVDGFHLGLAATDAEADGQPQANALGDDSNGTDDEDGVTFGTLTVGQAASVTVNATQPGKLDAWIDFNDDGDWADAGEQITAIGGSSLSAGPNTVSFAVPSGITPTPQTFARFRFSSAGGLAPTGAAVDGEVEDYAVAIDAPSGELVITANDPGGNGADSYTPDTYRLVRNGSNVDVYIGSSLASLTWSKSAAIGSFNRITVVGSGDNDLLVVDLSGGDLIPSGGLLYNAGESVGDRDALVVQGYNVASLTSTYTGLESGTIRVGSGALISYQNTEPLTLDGTAADLTIDLSQTGVQNPDAILADDGGVGDPNGVQDAGFSSIRGSTFEYTQFANPTNLLSVRSGASGDTVSLTQMDSAFAPTAGVSLIGDAGSDTFLIDDNGAAAGGKVDHVKYPVSVSGGGAVNTLTLEGSDNTDSALILTATTVSNNPAFPTTLYFGTGGSVAYAGLSQLVVRTGAQDDTAEIWGTASGTTTRLESGAGDDLFDVFDPALTLDNLLGPLEIVSGEGGETHGDWLTTFDDYSSTPDSLITVTAAAIVGAAPASISYQDLEEVFLNAPDDFAVDVDVLSNSADFYIKLGDTGTNTVTVGNTKAAFGTGGTLDGVAGRVEIRSSGGVKILQVDDSASSAADAAAIENWLDPDDDIAKTRITGMAAGGAILSYYQGTLDQLAILGGAGADSFDVRVTTAATSTTLDAGAGSDAVTIAADNLTAANVFRGGAGADQFVLSVTSNIAAGSLEIDGDAPAADPANRDQLQINDAASGRVLQFPYADPVSGGMLIAGFAVPVDVRTMENIDYFGDNAQATVSATSTIDHLTVTPVDPTSARLAINGGVAAGSPGPDLFFSGLNSTAGFFIDGLAPSFVLPGDTLAYEGTAALVFTGVNQGTLTGANAPVVNFRDIELVEGDFDFVIDADDHPDADPQINDGLADTFKLVRTGPSGEFLEIWIGYGTNPLVRAFMLDYASVASLTINGSSDADTLIVCATGGLIALPEGINFNGDALPDGPNAGDTLIFEGEAPSGPVARETYASGPALGRDPSDGVVVFDPDDLPGADYGNLFAALDGDEQVVVFDNLTPIIDVTPVVQLDILATNGNDDIQIIDGDPALATTRVTAPTFERQDFANKTTVTVNGLHGADTFHLNNPNPAQGLQFLEIYGNELPAIGVSADDGASEGFDLIAVGSTVTTVRMFGQAGEDLFTNLSITPTSDLGGLQANLELVGGADSDTVELRDPLDPTADLATLTDAKLTGAAIGEIAYSEVELFGYEATSGDDTIDVLSTALGTTYLVGGDGGSDTFTIGTSTASFQTGAGSLDAILGPITIMADSAGPLGAADTLNVDDSGDPDADVASISDAAGGVFFARTTSLSGFAPASIAYEYTPGAEELEYLHILGSQGGNTITVDATTASVQTTIDSGAGNDANTVAGDYLSAANLFVGNAGDDLFLLNIADNLGVSAIFPMTALWIEGNDHNPATAFNARDRLVINDLKPSENDRTLAWQYGFSSLDGSQGDGRLTGFAVPVDVFTMETVNYAGDASSNDTIRVETTPSGVADSLSFVPTSATQGQIFLNGTPWAGPPADYYASLPGVAGGGSGPDLIVSGVRQADGMTLAGKQDDRLLVYAPSEHNVEDDGDQVDGNGNVVIPGLPVLGFPNAYDRITVTTAAVVIYNPSAGLSLLQANIDGASFRQSSDLTDGLVVNAGFEADPDAANLADWIDASFTFDDGSGLAGFPIRINGGDPLPSFAPAGDFLQLNSGIGDINVFSDASNPPVVTITSSDPLSGLSSFPVRFSSIENVMLQPGTGVVNIYGDNNTPGVVQNDYFRVRGVDVDLALGGDPDGANEFQLEIGTKANVGDAPVLSAPISFRGVNRINVFGGSQGETQDTGVDTLDITAYANNQPMGWDIETYFDEGDPVNDQDMLLVNGLAGISERFVVQPSASQAGQVTVTNAATGTVIAVVNYVSNTGLEIVGNDGSAGDTDRLILRGTDGVTQVGTSGRETVDVNFAAAIGSPLVSVTDTATGNYLYQLYANTVPFTFDTVYFEMDGGDDVVNLVNVPGMTVYVDGGAATSSDAVSMTVDADARVVKGPDAESGVIDQTGVGEVYFSHVESVALNTATADSKITVQATDGNDAIGVQPLGNGASVSLDDDLSVAFNTAANNFSRLVVEALAGDDTIDVTPIAGVRVDVNGGAPEASDKLTVNALAGVADGLTLTVTAQGAGTLDASAVAGAVNVAYSGIEQLVLAHQRADGDSSSIEGTIGSDLFEFAHATTGDPAVVTGTLDLNNATGVGPIVLPSISLTGIDPAAGVNLNANVTGGQDTVVIRGTAENDALTATGGVVANSIAGQAVSRVTIGGSSLLVLDGGDGDDTFDVVPDAAYSVTVQGGDPSASDVLNFLGTGAGDLLIDLENLTITENGLGAVSISGVETINIDALGKSVEVWGTSDDDSIRYAPTGATSGQVSLAGLNALFAIQNVNILNVDGLGGSDHLTVDATNNADTIAVSGASVAVNDGSSDRLTVNLFQIEALAVNALAGDDVINVTPAAIPIFVDGGDPIGTTPGDRLNLVGGPAIFQAGPETDEGAFLVGGSARVSFDHIEGISNSGGGPVIVTGTNGDDDITIIARDVSTHATADGNQDFTVSVNDSLEWLFIDVPELYVDGLAGDDDIVIRAPAPNLVDWNVLVHVVGGTPSASDTLIFETPGTNQVTFRPTGADTGVLTLKGQTNDSTISIEHDFTIPSIGYISSPGGIEHLVYDGENGNDTLEVVLDAAAVVGNLAAYSFDTFTLTGKVEVNTDGSQRLPIAFQNLSLLGSVRITGNVAADNTLVYQGRSDVDQITVASSGVITDDPISLPVIPVGIQDLMVLTGDGDDVITVAADNPFDGIYVVGGEPGSGSDVLNYVATPGASTIVDLAAMVVAQTVPAGSPVSFVAIETVNVVANGALTVAATAGPDRLEVTPTSTSSGTVLAGDSLPVVTFAAASAFTVDLRGGSDALVVNASADSDAPIAVSGTAVAVPGKITVSYVGAEALTVNGLQGDDVFDVTPAAIPIFVDGGDPIGTTPGDRLNVLAGTETVVFEAGPETDEGAFLVGSHARVSFDHLEGFTATGGGSIIITGTNADDDITIIARDGSTHTGADGEQDFTVSVNNGPEMLFLDVPALYVDGMAGDDTVVIRAPAPNQADWNLPVYVVGGPSSVGDRLVLETPGDNRVRYRPTGDDTGTFTLEGSLLPSYVFIVDSFAGVSGIDYVSSPGGIEQVIYDGENGGLNLGDELLIELDATLSDAVTYAFDPITGTGSVAVNSGGEQRLGLAFQNISAVGSLGSLTIVDNGGDTDPADSLLYLGTSLNDEITVPSTGMVTNFGGAYVPLLTTGIERLGIDSGDGDDTLSVATVNPFQAIAVSAGNPSASDRLVLAGAADTAETITIQPNAVDSHKQDILGLSSSLTVSDVEVISYAGVPSGLGAADDTLVVDPLFGAALRVDSAPLANVDRVISDSLPEIQFTGLQTFRASLHGTNAYTATFVPTGLFGAMAYEVAASGVSKSLVIEGDGGINQYTLTRPTPGSVAVRDDSRGISITETSGGLALLNILGLGGDDQVTVDVEGLSGSDVIGAPIFFDGGEGADQLTVSGDPATAVDEVIYSVGPELSAGGLRYEDATDAALMAIDFANLEPVTDLVVATTLTIKGTAADNAVNFTASGGNGLATVDAYESIAFNNKTNVTLAARAGSDTINVNGLAGFTGTLRVEGGDDAAGDQLILSGTGGADTVTVAPTAPDAATVTGLGAITIDARTIEKLVLDGQGGNDGLTVSTPAGADLVTYTPGAARDSASVQVGSLVPFSFLNLGLTASVSLLNAGLTPRQDTLLHQATANDDLFSVDAAGQVLLNDRVAVNTAGVATLRLAGLAGDDTFNVAGNHNLPSIVVEGGDPSASDVLNFTGTGTEVTVDLAAMTVAEAGFGPVALSGIERLNLAANGNVVVNATTGNNSLTYAPTGAAAGQLTLAGLNTLVDLSTVGTLTVNALGGNDLLTVNATQADETIDVSDAAVDVNGLLPAAISGFEALTVNGRAGSDLFRVTPSATVPIFVDGGDPIGTTPGDRLTVIAGGGAVQFEPGPESDEGAFLVGPNRRVSFDHIEGLAVDGGGLILVLGTNGDDDITIIARDLSTHAGTDGSQDFTVTVNDGPEMLFIDTPAIYVDPLAGDDTIVVRAPAPNGENWDVDVFMVGGPSSANDTLVFETPGTNVVTYQPTGADTGTFVLKGTTAAVDSTLSILSQLPAIPGLSYVSSPGGIEHVVYDGENGDDELQVILDGTAQDVVTYRFDQSTSTGSVDVTTAGLQRLGLQFQNISNSGSVAINDPTINQFNDQLLYYGSALSDSIWVDNSGTIINAAITNSVPLLTDRIESLVLEGLEGDDTFNLLAGHPFSRIDVWGGDPDASDVLNLQTSGYGDVIVDLTNAMINEVDHVVGLKGVEMVNLDAAANNVNVYGTVGRDTIGYTATDVDAGLLTVGGMNTKFAMTNVDGLTVDGLNVGDGDTVTVYGSVLSDDITVARDVNTTTVSQPNLQALAIVSTTTEALIISSGLGDDVIHVTGSGGPALTVESAGNGLLDVTTPSATVKYGPSLDIGTVNNPGGNIAFKGIWAINLLGDSTGGLIVEGTDASNAIDQTANRVTVDERASVTFDGYATLRLKGNNGDDTISVQPTALPLGTELFVDGGSPSASDKLIVDGSEDADAITFSPTTPDAGTVDVNGILTHFATIEQVVLDGQGGDDGLTVITPTGANTITYTPGASVDSASVRVDSLVPMSFVNLGSKGAVTLRDTLDAPVNPDSLIYNGTATNDQFDVPPADAASAATILLRNAALPGSPAAQLPVSTMGVANLVLNGLAGVDVFNLNASIVGLLPYANITLSGGDTSGSDVANLTGTAGLETIEVDLEASTIAGLVDGLVKHVGVEVVKLDGVAGAADVLNVSGTATDDRLIYTPTGSQAGTFRKEGASTTFSFANIGGDFTLFGGAGADDVADEVVVIGTNSHDVVTIDASALPNPTAAVENAAGTVLKQVALDASIETVTAQTGLGNDTIVVIPAPNRGEVPAHKLPGNLLIHVDGGPTGDDALVIAGTAAGTALPESDYAVVNRSRATDEGTVRVFRDTVAMPDITYVGVEIVSPIVSTDSFGDPKLLVMGPDRYEPNEYRTTAAYLGSGATINVADLAIFPAAGEHRFVVPDHDFFRVVAQSTGTMDFQAYFRALQDVAPTGIGLENLVPGGGNLDLVVRDADGTIIAGTGAFGTNDGVDDFPDAVGRDNDERVRIPVVAGQTYYLEVYGVGGADSLVTNAYSLSIVNTPAQVPYDLELDDVIVEGAVTATSPNPASFNGSANLSTVDNFYQGKVIHVLSGLRTGQRATITGYVGLTKTFTLSDGLSGALKTGDKFQIESVDTGRSQLDNITRDNTPTIFFRLDDAMLLNDLPGNPTGLGEETLPPDQRIRIPFQDTTFAPGYRIAIFDEGSTPPQTGTEPQTPLGYATAVPGSQGVYTFTVPDGLALSDGSHFLSARLQMIDPSYPQAMSGFGSRSVSLEVVIDTQAPAAYFGDPTLANDGLDASSDTGVSGQPATYADGITSDTTPTFWGMAEANNVVRLYADLNADGLLDLGTDLYLGQTTATPLSGTNQHPDGYWTFTTSIDLNDPKYFTTTKDGVRTIFVTGEDTAGNVTSTAPNQVETLQIFLDTRAPWVGAVSYADGVSVFDPKPYQRPTPMANEILVTFVDLPARADGFDYPAVNTWLATTIGNYQLVGDANGTILISGATVVNDVDVEEHRFTTVRLTFAAPLPDDRFTLTIFDRIRDDAGNALDGDARPAAPGVDSDLFPSGDGVPGGNFVARFTVDSRPEVGVWASGSIWVDTNGNFTFDPQNTDATNRDITYKLGITSDDVFAGDFTPYASSVTDGFDKLAAYGRVDNQYRWLIDVDNDGVADIDRIDPANINGLPIAGQFDGDLFNGDEVAVMVSTPDVAGSTWYFDTDHDYQINTQSRLVSQLQGFPFVGDFNGDGYDDLGTWQNDVFQIDLAGPVGANGLPWDGTADATFRFGFLGVRERPVAADMNGDGFEDLGLWVPDRTGMSSTTCEWYFLVSGPQTAGAEAVSILDRADVKKGAAEFKPVPFGNDTTARFGDQFALPLVGNFDPPVAGAPKTLWLQGTEGADSFEFTAGPDAASWSVTINGVLQTVDSGVTAIQFNALGGNDQVIFNGTAGSDHAEFWADHAEFRGDGYGLTVSSAETITANGLAGSDTAVFHDTAGDDTVTAGPNNASLIGSGLTWTVNSFKTFTALATAGGVDVAHLFDSAGNDTLDASPEGGKLSGTGFTLEAKGFESVYAYARKGTDTANFSDSAGNDVFSATSIVSTISGSGFLRQARSFDRVNASSTQGGVDWARLKGTSGNETFVATPTKAEMTGSTFYYSAAQFEVVIATAGAGTDTAHLYDSAGDDTLTATPRGGTLTTADGSYKNVANGFDYLHAYATTGDTDVAMLYDSAGNDTFVGDTTESRLTGLRYYIRAKAFDYVHACATAGGYDVAKLKGSAGNDSLLADTTYTRMSGDGFFYRAWYFEEVQAYGGKGVGDTAELRNTTFQRGSAATTGTPTGFKQVLTMYQFEQATVKNKPAKGGQSAVNAVDEVFRSLW